MTDERLRALEHRSSESPEDLALGHELARALERAGETRRAARELVRLMRAGDDDARRIVRRWTATRSTQDELGLRDGPALPTGARMRRIDLDGGPFGWHLECADDERLFFALGGDKVALDARSLEVAWRRAWPPDAEWLAPSLARSGARRLDVLGRDGLAARSREAAVRLVAAAASSMHIATIEVEERSSRVALLDRGSLSVLWTRPIVDRVDRIALRADCVLLVGRGVLRDDFALAAYDLGDGRTLWERGFERSAPALVAIDEQAVLLRWHDRYIEFDLATGADRRYEGGLAPCTEARLCDERVVFARPWEIEAVSRAKGRSLWRVHPGLYDFAETSVAGAHVWSVRGREEEPQAEVTVYELASGLDMRREVVPTAPGHQARARWVPLDGAMILLAGPAERLTAVRFE